LSIHNGEDWVLIPQGIILNGNDSYGWSYTINKELTEYYLNIKTGTFGVCEVTGGALWQAINRPYKIIIARKHIVPVQYIDFTKPISSDISQSLFSIPPNTYTTLGVSGAAIKNMLLDQTDFLIPFKHINVHELVRLGRLVPYNSSPSTLRDTTSQEIILQIFASPDSSLFGVFPFSGNLLPTAQNTWLYPDTIQPDMRPITTINKGIIESSTIIGLHDLLSNADNVYANTHPDGDDFTALMYYAKKIVLSIANQGNHNISGQITNDEADDYIYMPWGYTRKRTDILQADIDAIDNELVTINQTINDHTGKFSSGDTGHKHTGVNGDAPKIPTTSIESSTTDQVLISMSNTAPVWGQIITAMIADNAVTAEKLAVTLNLTGKTVTVDTPPQ